MTMSVKNDDNYRDGDKDSDKDGDKDNESDNSDSDHDDYYDNNTNIHHYHQKCPSLPPPP